MIFASILFALFGLFESPEETNVTAQADNGLLGAGLTARRVTVESSNVVSRAWRRDVVMVNGEGEITGDGGVVGEKASTDAIDTVASNSYQISAAAISAMDTAMDYVYSKTNSMAPYCVMTAIHVAPETVRSNVTGFVVKTTTDGTTDHQWVWYDRVLGFNPIRYVTYSYYGGQVNVKCSWVNWTTNGVSVTVGGTTWSGCHECTVARPSFAINETCLDLPNEEWGGANGINWGDMTLVYEGDNTYFTGYITNSITQEVLYFDQGFLKTAQ